MPAAPTFDEFFQGAFQRALGAVHVPGAPDASWDRKAAYLLWRAINGDLSLPSEPTPSEDVFG